MNVVLDARDLWKRFGEFTAVKGASLHVNEGEVVALIGPNGAGKTTLFDLLTGRKIADKGRIELFGEDVTDLPPWKRVHKGVGRSFQVSSIFPQMTVLENVQTGFLISSGSAFGLKGQAARCFRDEAFELLEQAGLLHQQNQLGSELSYGDQRALELAVTLSSRPKILLLDEPTAGMGTIETQECLSRIRAIAASRKIPVLFVEHDMSVVFSFATRVVVLAGGEVIFAGSPEEVRRNEKVKEVYFGEDL